MICKIKFQTAAAWLSATDNCPVCDYDLNNLRAAVNGEACTSKFDRYQPAGVGKVRGPKGDLVAVTPEFLMCFGYLADIFMESGGRPHLPIHIPDELPIESDEDDEEDELQ